MGSVAVAAAIVFATFFVSFALLYSATIDAGFHISRAQELHATLIKNYYESSIEILSVNNTYLGLAITILNNGSVVLNPSYLNVLVDGVYVEILSAYVGSYNTTIWTPGETAEIQVNATWNYTRIKVVTEFGSVAYYWR